MYQQYFILEIDKGMKLLLQILLEKNRNVLGWLWLSLWNYNGKEMYGEGMVRVLKLEEK